MDEPTAWLYQAKADRLAAERLVADGEGMGRCHAIAKYQQTVEKAVKALMATLFYSGISANAPRASHDAEPYVRILLRLPRDVNNREVQQLLRGILDGQTREEIKALDRLVPRLPPRRNTEYPFQDAGGLWTYPASESVFSKGEVDRFRPLAFRVLNGVERAMSVVRRRCEMTKRPRPTIPPQKHQSRPPPAIE